MHKKYVPEHQWQIPRCDMSKSVFGKVSSKVRARLLRVLELFRSWALAKRLFVTGHWGVSQSKLNTHRSRFLVVEDLNSRISVRVLPRVSADDRSRNRTSCRVARLGSRTEKPCPKLRSLHIPRDRARYMFLFNPWILSTRTGRISTRTVEWRNQIFTKTHCSERSASSSTWYWYQAEQINYAIYWCPLTHDQSIQYRRSLSYDWNYSESDSEILFVFRSGRPITSALASTMPE